jgi:hypothetical protein
VSEDEARKAIADGRSFAPDTNGSIWHRKGASAAHLAEHLFYREAGMFVSYMRSLDHARFTTLLSAVEEGSTLDEAFRGAYGVGVADVWQRFTAEAKSRP